MMQSEQVHIKVSHERKEQLRKWASRRGLTIASLLNSSVNYYVSAYPVEGYHDEAKMARNLAAREGVNDESII